MIYYFRFRRYTNTLTFICDKFPLSEKKKNTLKSFDERVNRNTKKLSSNLRFKLRFSYRFEVRFL